LLLPIPLFFPGSFFRLSPPPNVFPSASPEVPSYWLWFLSSRRGGAFPSLTSRSLGLFLVLWKDDPVSLFFIDFFFLSSAFSERIPQFFPMLVPLFCDTVDPEFCHFSLDCVFSLASLLSAVPYLFLSRPLDSGATPLQVSRPYRAIALT